MIVGLVVDPAQFFASYLAAWLFCLNIALGSMVLVMIYHLTGGAWGYLLRGLLEAAVRTLPLLAIGFVPIALGLQYLYLWARPEVVQSNELLQQQHVYMNVPFFWIRAAVYFALWLLFAGLLNWWSGRQERGARGPITDWLNTLSGIGLGVLWRLDSFRFGRLDFVAAAGVSLDHLRSAVGIAAIAQRDVADGDYVRVVMRAGAAGGNRVAQSAERHRQLAVDVSSCCGRTWAGSSTCSRWIANLPADVIWYVDRLRGFWGVIAVGLVLLQFAVPFVLLLQRSVKRRPWALASVAGLSLVMQWVFMNFQILPAVADNSEHDLVDALCRAAGDRRRVVSGVYLVPEAPAAADGARREP